MAVSQSMPSKSTPRAPDMPAKKTLAKKARATAAVPQAAPAKKTTAKKISLSSVENHQPAEAVPAANKLTRTAEERYKMIAAAAYLRAEKRGFQGGNALEDWVAAEAEIDATL